MARDSGERPGGPPLIASRSPVPRPPVPILLTSLASAVLGDGAGDLRYVRECRGAPAEWGGVYGQLIRLTGPWTVGLESSDSATDLPSCRVEAGSIPGGWRSHHHWNGLDIVQDVAVTARPAGAVRRLRFRSEVARETRVVLTTRFSPFLFPVLVEGIRPLDFEARTTPDALVLRHQGFAVRISSNLAPSHLLLNQASWIGGKYRGPVDEVALEYEMIVPAGGAAEVRWQIAGGLGRHLDATWEEKGTAPPDPDVIAGEQATEERAWVGRTPELTFPDAPELDAGYRAARAALRRLYSAPDETLVGLVAGYPWYSAIWCRDLAVMLPALLWLGDFDWVGRSLATVFRFQSRKKVTMLAGEPGELPMQLAPGPIFLYGTSDSTLRFPAVVEQMHRHTGDLSSVADWAGAVHRIVEWGRGRSDPTTGLLRHGGEAEGIGVATAGLGRIHYGIDSPDTTIWDSADRRDFAIDVQVLWRESLGAAAVLLGHAADLKRRATCEQLAAQVASTIRDRYPWESEGYLYDSLREGRPVAQVRPNALRAVSAGILDPERARAAVRRAGADDLTTSWGVRSLSSRDPAYDPQAYHEGQVWTIATAWAADAAFAVGDRTKGVEYLRTIASRYLEEDGLANECYRGDRPEAYNSCGLLGFSVAPFVSLLFERLWGIRIAAVERSIRVVPAFPTSWTSASLRGLRVADGTLDLTWNPGRLRVRWTGSGSLSIDTGAGVASVESGPEAVLDLPPAQEPS
ncbi:MAG: hypothetical protein L3K10_01455 [Thermoplasmata archaeon]|nr:hypothetical protein [Thermoplasmata archaeon]